MPVKTIRLFNDPILRRKAKKVVEFGEQWLPLVEDLYDTCLAKDGAGLAAPQIGESVQVAVVYLRRQNEEPLKLALFNPEILSAEGELSYEEGCLSVPEITETVIRPQKIKLSFQDYAGKEQEMEADEVLARVIQHEIDHLYGTLFFDHLSRVKRALIKNKLKKILTGEVGK